MRFFKSKRRMVLLGTALLLTILLGTTLTVLAHDWPFGDVSASSPFYWNIRRIAVLNISPTGCGGGNFCPKANVTREQMAAYMDRFTKAWTDEDEPYILNLDHRDILNNRPAIIAQSNDGNGVNGISYGAGFADNGVYGRTNSTDSAEAGVFGYSTDSATGVYGYNSDSDTSTTVSYGVRAYSYQGYGVYSYAANDFAVYATGYGGVRAAPTGSAAGIYATTPSGGGDGATISAAANDGVYAAAAGGSMWGLWAQSNDSYGVYANTNVSGGYGLYTPDRIYTAGGCVGCTSMIIAQNGGETTLEPGDVVAVVGIAEGPTEFYARPVLLVQKADLATSQAVVGVVDGRYVTKIVTKEETRLTPQAVEVTDPEGLNPPETVYVDEETVETYQVEDAQWFAEPAAPGDKLTVVYRGLIQVKVDASLGAIQVGDRLAIGSDGYALKAQPVLEGQAPGGLALGLALEPLAEGQGLVWVLVDLQ
jgi:hypothetical protein